MRNRSNGDQGRDECNDSPPWHEPVLLSQTKGRLGGAVDLLQPTKRKLTLPAPKQQVLAVDRGERGDGAVFI